MPNAQMAESVDALVSNTSRFTPVPVRPRLWVLKEEDESLSLFFVSVGLATVRPRAGAGQSGAVRSNPKSRSTALCPSAPSEIV